jgi:hypothetical protein
MRVLNVEPRDFHIILDLSLKEVEHILTYLGRCTASPDANNPEWPEADKFVRQELFPNLDKLCDNIKEQAK